MRTLISTKNALLMIAIFVSVLVPIAAVSQSPNTDFKDDNLIISLEPGLTQEQIQAVIGNQWEFEKEFGIIGAQLWRLKAGVSASGPNEVLAAIGRYEQTAGSDWIRQRIRYVQPNYMIYLIGASSVPDDHRFPELWGLHNTGQTGGASDADIDMPEAWYIEEGRVGSEVVVAVIDTGVDYSHEDLAQNMWTNPGEIPGDGLDNDENGFVDDIHGYDFYNNNSDPLDDNGHGTHVAGTIAAARNNGLGVAGISRHAKIMALKFLGQNGYGNVSDAVSALEYAINNGAMITNNSWGTFWDSEPLRETIEAAQNAGQLFIAAAGNSNRNTDLYPHYPSSYNLDCIISVASSDHNDQRSDFSNYGLTSVDLAAPGSDILSTLPGNLYGTMSGTSMATPHVSGVAALLWSIEPTLSWQEVKQRIMNSVDPIPALSGLMVTGGRLNAFNAVAPACEVPASGDWIITENCTLKESVSAPANVRVENGAVLTLVEGIELNIDLVNYALRVQNGSGVLVRKGAKIQ